MQLKKLLGAPIAMLITVFLLLLLTSPLWIGWMMEYEHNKTKNALANHKIQCKDGTAEKREVWSKLGIAIYCQKDNIKNGVWQAWDGGYMHISGEYMNGKKHGVWKYFNALGEQWGSRTYDAGEEVTELINLLTADSVLVRKQERRLDLIRNGTVYRSYAISLGAEPTGHKQEQGDKRTPEGHYMLDYRNEDSKYHKSIHISYPNNMDKKMAQKADVEPGGDIMIHGQPSGFGWAWRVLNLFNWTNGSIAVNNRDMDEILDLVQNNTPIEITP